MGLILLRPYSILLSSNEHNLEKELCILALDRSCWFSSCHSSSGFRVNCMLNTVHLTLSQFITGRQVCQYGYQWKTTLCMYKLIFLQIYIHISNNTGEIVCIPFNVTFICVCHLWVEEYGSDKHMLCIWHFHYNFCSIPVDFRSCIRCQHVPIVPKGF